jgi:diketogulonate reductase-like aldo/keto reductase
LSSGHTFPLIGFGTFGGVDAPHQVYEATKAALKAGYRHIDTAYVCKYSLYGQKKFLSHTQKTKPRDL